MNRKTKSNIATINRIKKKYGYPIVYHTEDITEAYCLPYIAVIYLPNYKGKASNKEVFDVLHEIGHVKTNEMWMQICEEEYTATQWAIDHADEFGVEVTDELLKLFQDYIWDWWKKRNKNGRRVTKKSLTLVKNK